MPVAGYLPFGRPSGDGRLPADERDPRGISWFAALSLHADGILANSRATIADHLSLVPFLDALVVERSPRQLPGVPAVLVALDLLPDLLVQGPPVVPVDVVAGVRRLLTGQLLGAWRVDAAQPADTIVLCDPTQATTSPT